MSIFRPACKILRRFNMKVFTHGKVAANKMKILLMMICTNIVGKIYYLNTIRFKIRINQSITIQGRSVGGGGTNKMWLVPVLTGGLKCLMLKQSVLNLEIL